MVSIPRDWIRSNGLEPGGSLRVLEAGPGRLLLEDVRAKAKGWEATVHAGRSEPLEHLFRCLVASYLTGTTDLVLEAHGPLSTEVRRTVQEFARRSGRMEVVFEGSTSITLRDISGTPTSDPIAIVVRMARAALDLQRRAGEQLAKAPTTEEEGYWENLDDEVDRLEWRVHRALACRALNAPAESLTPQGSSANLHLLAVSRALERIADHAVRIGRACSSLPRPHAQPPRLRSVTEFHRQVLGLIERVIPLLESPNPAEANEIVDVAESLHASHMALLQSLLSSRSPTHLPPLTAGWLALVLDSVDRSAAYVADIAELSLDRAALGWVRPRRGPAVEGPSSYAAALPRPASNPRPVHADPHRSQGTP